MDVSLTMRFAGSASAGRGEGGVSDLTTRYCHISIDFSRETRGGSHRKRRDRLSVLHVARIGPLRGVGNAQVDLARQGQEAGNKANREQGRLDMIRPFDEDKAYRNTVIGMAVGTGMTCAFPLFLGFYLSRRRVTDEIKDWA